MVSLDDYAAARDRRDSAEAQVVALGAKLRHLADLLQHPELVRINEPVTIRVERTFPYILDASEVPTWPQIADALRVFLGAQDDYLLTDSLLSPEQRQHVRPDR